MDRLAIVPPPVEHATAEKVRSSAFERAILSHVGIFVHDLATMEAFYASVLGLIVTDRGRGKTFDNDLVFMSGDPAMHHQFLLSSGRPADATVSTINQLSFKVKTLDMLRGARARALAHGARDLIALDHGNAWSIYFKDPEGNTVEVYLDSPFYVPQPHGDPLDLDKSDEEIVRTTEAACRSDEGFMVVEAWQAEMAKRLA